MPDTTERFTMYHAKTGGKAETTAEAFEKIWKDKGWRKTEPKSSDK